MQKYLRWTTLTLVLFQYTKVCPFNCQAAATKFTGNIYLMQNFLENAPASCRPSIKPLLDHLLSGEPGLLCYHPQYQILHETLLILPRVDKGIFNLLCAISLKNPTYEITLDRLGDDADDAMLCLNKMMACGPQYHFTISLTRTDIV